MKQKYMQCNKSDVQYYALCLHFRNSIESESDLLLKQDLYTLQDDYILIQCK